MDLISPTLFQIIPKMYSSWAEKKNSLTLDLRKEPNDNTPNKIIENIYEKMSTTSPPPARSTLSPPSPRSTPSPPAPLPPPAPLWTPQIMKEHMNRIMKKLQKIELKVTEPHIISIQGIQHLHPQNLTQWKERLQILLFENKIPLFWILDVIPDYENDNINDDDDDDDDNPNLVHLYTLNHAVKVKIINILKQYLFVQYNDLVYILQ
jgi:hypothetical protein